MMNKLAAALLALTAGCASETDGAFHVSGRLADQSSVTHVVASNPQNATRVAAEMNVDGSFELALTPGYQWVITFADSTKTGSAMQVATLQAGALDALQPQGPGSLDLGMVSFGTERAMSTVAWADLIDALGIDDATATRMGRVDNLALRYANPDIDNDGIMDYQQGHALRLDVDGAYQLTTEGRDVTITDLGTGYSSPNVRYLGTTLQAALPQSMGMEMTSASVTFDQPFYGSAMGPNTPMVPAGTAIGQPHVKFGQLDGVNMVGVVARAGFDAPKGTYELGFSNGQLSFTDVFPPAAAVVESARDYAVPFIRIHPTTSTCTVNCAISEISLDWRKLTSAGWDSTNAPAVHIDILAKRNGTPTYLAANLEAGTSTLAWSDVPVANTGILWNELSYIGTSQICYMAVSYQSELGMKMTQQVLNPGCY